MYFMRGGSAIYLCKYTSPSFYERLLTNSRVMVSENCRYPQLISDATKNAGPKLRKRITYQLKGYGCSPALRSATTRINSLFLFLYGVGMNYFQSRSQRSTKNQPLSIAMSPLSSGSIVSDYGLDDWAVGVRSLAGAKDFFSILCVQSGSGAHLASYTMGTGVLSPGVKRGRVVTLTTHPM
jgi:hypothetical protein